MTGEPASPRRHPEPVLGSTPIDAAPPAPEGGAPTPGALRAFLRERIPEHMIPAQFVVMDDLPLLPNGKVDRRALPAPPRAGGGGGIPPRTPLERMVAEAWEEVLQVDGVGALDSFFALGGNSLHLVSLGVRLGTRLARPVPVAELLQNATVEAMAAYLERGGGMPPAPAAAPEGRLRGAAAGLARARLEARRTAEGGRDV
jgi:hypothetical protein